MSLCRILLQVYPWKHSKADKFDSFRQRPVSWKSWTRLLHKRDLESVLRDLYTNKTPQTKKGGFKEAWRMSTRILHSQRPSAQSGPRSIGWNSATWVYPTLVPDLRYLWRELFSAYPHTNTRSLGSNSITPLSPEPALHPKHNRYKKTQNSLNLSFTCIWHPRWTFVRCRNPPSPINAIRSPRPTALETHHDQTRHSPCTLLQTT